MAEAGAHLSSNAAPEQPSIFEALAQESLMEAVKPALRHAVKVLAESNPSRYGFLWRCFDELYLLLDVLLQNHFLSHCSASFSENFYGLKRVSGRYRAQLGLSSKSHWRSLLLLCLVPYLRAKLDSLLARHRDEEDFSIRLGQSRWQRMYRAAVAAYPYVSSAWQALVFCQQLLFVFGVAKSHSPLLWLARVSLARLSAQDIRDMELRWESEQGPVGGSLMHRTWHLLSQATRGLAVSLSTTLSLGVFFLQFLEWWYSSDNQSTMKTLTALPAPPPPSTCSRPIRAWRRASCTSKCAHCVAGCAPTPPSCPRRALCSVTAACTRTSRPTTAAPSLDTPASCSSLSRSTLRRVKGFIKNCSHSSV
uniref:Peroxisome assembly protein 12 n=1 Tax=Neogobius melanostomus TaxID=47308 RepID=A0A8C6U8W1_9GOBI